MKIDFFFCPKAYPTYLYVKENNHKLQTHTNTKTTREENTHKFFFKKKENTDGQQPPPRYREALQKRKHITKI
jgi:hypothetical protein